MTKREPSSSSPPKPETRRHLLLWGTALVALLTPILVLLFVFILSEFNPYCDGDEDRIRCAMRLVGVTHMSVLPAAVIDLFVVAAMIGVWRRFSRWRSVRPAEP
jgi:hypothetical protein